MKIIYCRGGDKDAPKIAEVAGAYYGRRDDYTGYSRPYMLDWDFGRKFTTKRWDKYLRAIDEHRPEIALIPDYFSHVSRAQMETWVSEVQSAGAGAVLVCPKFLGAVSHIPENAIIAISVPTEYAGFLPPASEIVGRKLHLLGGHPDAQAYIMRYLYPGENVVSVDANIAGFKAAHGQWWCALTGNWKHAPRNSVSNFDLAVRTLKATRDYFQDEFAPIRMRPRVQKCQPQLLAV